MSDPGDYKQAKGALPWEAGDELPEDAIRRFRDGGYTVPPEIAELVKKWEADGYPKRYCMVFVPVGNPLTRLLGKVKRLIRMAQRKLHAPQK